MFQLEAKWLEKELDGTRVRLRAFNGTVPGQMITTRPGDTLHLRLVNSLTPYDSSAWNGNHNVPHALDTTNLHLHGLEVVTHLFQPIGTSDATADMIAVRPGESKDYVIKLPDDHPPGLFWYHPHHHGSTVVQAVSGMAGGLIVHGDIDEVPEIKAARDIPLVVQDIGLFPSDQENGVYSYEPKQNAIWNTFTGQVSMWDPINRTMVVDPSLKGGFTAGDYALRFFLINGEPFFKEVHNSDNPTDPTGTQLNVPKIQMRPGEVVRFRLLNANSDLLMPVVVEGHEVHLLALDGVNFPQVRTIPVIPSNGKYPDQQILLAPANRADFLIKAQSRPGTYGIVQFEQSAQFLHGTAKRIAEIVVSGEPKNMALPDELPIPTRHYPLIKPGEVRRRRQIVFSGSPPPGYMNPIVGIDFMINNQLYDEEAINQTVDLGSVEEWKIRVPDSTHGGTEGHPFHVHVNSFEVISVNGRPQPPGTIQDTVWVENNSEVVIRMRFRQWPGKSVYHCHILPHEDTGMMQNFLIRKV